MFLKKVFYYPLTALYYLAFSSTLIIFHLVQLFSHRLLGYCAHKKSVDWLNFFFSRCLNYWARVLSFPIHFKMPNKGTLIIVSNHQIPMIFHPLYGTKENTIPSSSISNRWSTEFQVSPIISLTEVRF